MLTLAKESLKAPPRAVAFSAMTPDGISPLGWSDIRNFEAAAKAVVLHHGCYWVFAFADYTKSAIKVDALP